MADRRDDVRTLAAGLSAIWIGACGGASPLLGGAPRADAGVPEIATSDAAGESRGLPPLDVRLDPSFGMEGNLGGSLSLWTPTGVTVDPQRRVVVSGPGQEPDAPVQEVVRRFSDDGTLDETFGASGAATLAFDSYAWGQTDRTLSSGGIGILGAAALDGGQGAFALRLAADGSVDPNFAGAPLFAPDVGSFSMGLWQDDGSGFLLGGAGVVRFAANGVIDATYARGPMGPASAGALASDGRLWTASGNRVSRALASGAPDPAFGQGGAVDLPPAGAAPASSIETLLLEPDTGMAVVVASHPDRGSYNVDVIRLTPSGVADSAFAQGRFVSVPANGAPTGSAQLADGRVIVWTSYGDLVAIEPDGTPQSTSLLDVLGTVLAATLDPSQRLVVVGMATSDPLNSKWFVRRYLLF